MMLLEKRKITTTGLHFVTPLFFLAVAILLASCSKDEENEWVYHHGGFVINEGAWNNNNASVSFISFGKGIVYEDLFAMANAGNAVLGDVLMDLDVIGEEIYMVLNGSNKIQVVNKNDFRWTGTIGELDNPRYLLAYNGKLYVTQWGNGGSVVVVDITTNQVVTTIDVGNGPEGILAHRGKIWVANSGGFGKDNSVSVIDPATNSVISTIRLGDSPRDLVADANGDVWVVCHGYVIYSWNPPFDIIEQTASTLTRINGATREVEKTITISETEHPSVLDISPDGKTLYVGGGYSFGGIYTLSIAASNSLLTKLVQGNFYGFSVNPYNGDIYGCEAPSFTNPGLVKVIDASNGDLKQTYESGIGIGPRKVVF